MDYLKIAMLNASGNIGKSTLCETLIKPRFKGSEWISVESINSDNNDDVNKISSKNMIKTIQKIDEFDKCIIDVGSSNLENFFDGLKNGTHEDIDFYCVPVTPVHKVEVDTITTIESLLNIGVEAEQIKIIFNKVNLEESLADQFPLLFSNKELVKLFHLNDETLLSIVPDGLCFQLLNEIDKKYIELKNDTTDYRIKTQKAKSANDKKYYSLVKSCKRWVNQHEKHLEIAFSNLQILEVETETEVEA